MVERFTSTPPVPPTPEQLAHREAVNQAVRSSEQQDAALKTDQPSPENKTNATEKPQTDAEGADAAKSKSDAKANESRPSQDKQSTFGKDFHPTRGSQLPESMGRQTNIANAFVARDNAAAEQQKNTPDQPRRGKSHDFESRFERAQDLRDMPRERPMPDRPSPREMRMLAQDPMFRGPNGGTALHQKIQQKAVEEGILHHEVIERGVEDNLTRGEIVQLFRMRNQFEKKDEAKSLLRHELAKARHEARQKVQALKYQNESAGHKEEAQGLEKTGDAKGDALKDQLAQKLSQSSSESEFENILQQVLAGEESVPELPEGMRARFAAKTDAEWEGFFKNALSLSSSEVESEGQLDKLIEALFRGVYKRGADGKMLLVSDLSFTEGGEVAEHKFSRIALADPELVKAFGNLKPGDVISQELMKKIGDQFLFVQLLHMVDQLAVTEEQKKTILREYRQQLSSSSKKGLEDALIRNRSQDESQAKPSPLPSYAGDLFNKKERHIGPPKFLMWMIYGVAAVAVVIILTILFRQM